MLRPDEGPSGGPRAAAQGMPLPSAAMAVMDDFAVAVEADAAVTRTSWPGSAQALRAAGVFLPRDLRIGRCCRTTDAASPFGLLWWCAATIWAPTGCGLWRSSGLFYLWSQVWTWPACRALAAEVADSCALRRASPRFGADHGRYPADGAGLGQRAGQKKGCYLGQEPLCVCGPGARAATPGRAFACAARGCPSLADAIAFAQNSAAGTRGQRWPCSRAVPCAGAASFCRWG